MALDYKNVSLYPETWTPNHVVPVNNCSFLVFQDTKQGDLDTQKGISGIERKALEGLGRSVLDKLFSGMAYNAVDHEFNVKKSMIYIK